MVTATPAPPNQTAIIEYGELGNSSLLTTNPFMNLSLQPCLVQIEVSIVPTHKLINPILPREVSAVTCIDL